VVAAKPARGWRWLGLSNLVHEIEVIMRRFPQTEAWFRELLDGELRTADKWFVLLLQHKGLATVASDGRVKLRREAMKAVEEALSRKNFRSIWEIEPKREWFDDIIGHEDLKDVLLRVLKSPKPVHLLLVGPPSSAKTLVLEILSAVYGVPILLAGTSTRAGLRDWIAAYRPELLLIDELDKRSNPADLTVLLSWMESQRIAIAMSRKWGFEEVRCPSHKCIVVAAANRLDRLPKELVSRFAYKVLKPYTPEEVRKICVALVMRREGLSVELAEAIADAVITRMKSLDVRDCIKIARLQPTCVDEAYALAEKLAKT
jgi:Holliday junction DNA helicase RuvB